MQKSSFQKAGQMKTKTNAKIVAQRTEKRNKQITQKTLNKNKTSIIKIGIKEIKSVNKNHIAKIR